MKERWVYAAGVFDLLHYGHVRYLEAAKRMGDVLVVGLLSDEGTARYKKSRPIIPFDKRWEVIRALKCVDYIVCQEDTDPTNTLKMLKKEHSWKFDILCRGTDYKKEPPGTEFIKSNGGVVMRVEYSEDISSTKIKEMLLNEGRG